MTGSLCPGDFGLSPVYPTSPSPSPPTPPKRGRGVTGAGRGQASAEPNLVPTLLNNYCGPARGNHQHAIFLAHDLVIDVDADHGICAQVHSALRQLFQRNLPRALQLSLVGAGTASHQIPNPGKQILEQVGAEDGFTRNHPTISGD